MLKRTAGSITGADMTSMLCIVLASTEGAKHIPDKPSVPPLPSVVAWDPDAGAPPSSKGQGHFFFTIAGDVPTNQIAGWLS